MIGVIWKLILGGLWKPLLAVLGAAGLYVKGRADAKAKADSRALDATVKGQEAARKGRAEAVEKLRQGKTPEQIRRENDDAWR